MSNKCESCKSELIGDGGCKAPCNLCSENDCIKFIRKIRNTKNPIDIAIIIMLCNRMNITIQQLDSVKYHYELRNELDGN